MANKTIKPGDLFISIKNSHALTTNPWECSNKTIGYADHLKIDLEKIAILIEYSDIQRAGIYIWLLGEKVVWQVLNDEDFEDRWKHLENDKKKCK